VSVGRGRGAWVSPDVQNNLGNGEQTIFRSGLAL